MYSTQCVGKGPQPDAHPRSPIRALAVLVKSVYMAGIIYGECSGQAILLRNTKNSNSNFKAQMLLLINL